jgi:hypothetical protein
MDIDCTYLQNLPKRLGKIHGIPKILNFPIFDTIQVQGPVCAIGKPKVKIPIWLQ